MVDAELIDGGVCAVDGVFASGKKIGWDGAALISGNGKAVAVFTKNRLQAAHIAVTRENIASGKVAGVLVTSGNANCATGQRGIQDARRLCDIAGRYLHVPGKDIALASTGIIGRFIDFSTIEPIIGTACSNLRNDGNGARDAAKAMMTTDTQAKMVAARCGEFTVGGLAKGSGMIAPNMGTMIAVLYTDAHIAKRTLRKELQSAVDRTFNMVVVDGDTSPNDTIILVSTGRKKGQLSDFQQALYLVCRELAVSIASDGEGATKLMVVKVTGATTAEDARRCARAIVSSPLVKTAVTGADPNFGRVLSAAGNVLENLPLDKLRLSVSNKKEDVTFFSDGGPVEDTAQRAREIMQGKRVNFILDLNSGDGTATAWGCDLTADYVSLNAEYST